MPEKTPSNQTKGPVSLSANAEPAQQQPETVSGMEPPALQLSVSQAGTQTDNRNIPPFQLKPEEEVVDKMGEGQELSDPIRGTVESAWGENFSGVTIHTGDQAAQLATQHSAEALTVGRHIAFGQNAYQPNTMEGDALIAHELAHVAQQKESGSGSYSQDTAPLERDANQAATGLIAQLWSKGKGAARTAGARLKSGIQLMRCSRRESERIRRMRQMLEQIPGGREALRLREQYNVGIEERAGGGSYYDSGSNSMVLDTEESAQNAALTFVHEMNHARYHHEDLGADIQNDSREAYVRGMVEEEAEGTVRSIEAAMEFEGTDVDTTGMSFPLQAEYTQAYNDARAAETASNAEATEEELQRVGRAAGMQRVIDGFMNGEVQTSNTSESYPDYYGNAWDRAHPSE